MPDYRYLIVDASSGHNLCEAPLTPTSPYSRVLSGIGSFDATLPIDHPLATPDILDGDREITIIRDSIPVWNGPITVVGAQRTGGDDVVAITAREAFWYLTRRALEVSQSWTAEDIAVIARWLVDYAVGKEANGLTTGGTNINAALPRFSVSPASATFGTTKSLSYVGTARPIIADILNDLVADPTTGMDYRMDYGGGSNWQTCQRTLTFGCPSLGTALTTLLNEHVLSSYGRTKDRERAATRVHVVGSRYTYTAQNNGSVSNGDILLDGVWDRSDTSNQDVIQNFALEARRLAQPPVSTYQCTFTPSTAAGALPFGFADLGDTVPMMISTPTILQVLNVRRRVVQIDVTPPSDSSDETVTLGLNLPLDSLGA